jgi:hypothetical protein
LERNRKAWSAHGVGLQQHEAEAVVAFDGVHLINNTAGTPHEFGQNVTAPNIDRDREKQADERTS